MHLAASSTKKDFMSLFISLDEAKKMTADYRAKKKVLLAPEYKQKNVLPICESFDRAAIDKLLSQKDCKGIRIYYGIKNEDEVHAIVVGYNSNNEDILPATDQARTLDGTDGDGDILDNTLRCPYTCPPSSPLNQ